MDVNIFFNSSQSSIIELACSGVMYWDSRRSCNQYNVSRDSFDAIANLAQKSFFDCPASDSTTFAPIEVPLLSNCLDRTYSLRSSFRYLHNLIIRSANVKLLFLITFSLHTDSLFSNAKPIQNSRKEDRSQSGAPCVSVPSDQTNARIQER